MTKQNSTKLYIFERMKIRSAFPQLFPAYALYVQTEGQSDFNTSSTGMQTCHSLFSESLQAILFPNFLSIFARVKNYLHFRVF
jgi:hypothetical protein